MLVNATYQGYQTGSRSLLCHLWCQSYSRAGYNHFQTMKTFSSMDFLPTVFCELSTFREHWQPFFLDQNAQSLTSGEECSHLLLGKSVTFGSDGSYEMDGSSKQWTAAVWDLEIRLQVLHFYSGSFHEVAQILNSFQLQKKFLPTIFVTLLKNSHYKVFFFTRYTYHFFTADTQKLMVIEWYHGHGDSIISTLSGDLIQS